MRKVRTPNKQGTCEEVKFNVGGREPMDSATENNRHLIYQVVRVKTCGKSARFSAAMYWRGKPYLEQGKIGVRWVSLFPLEHAGMPLR